MSAPDFINSSTVRVREHLVLKGGGSQAITLGVRYGLWVHAKLGPILIDTGYGPEVMTAKGRSWPLKVYAAVIGARLIQENDPAIRLKALGFRTEDVKHILITHFHADHISRLKAFPKARLHASGTAYRTLLAKSELARLRHGHFFELLPCDFADRLVPYETVAPVDLPYGLGQGFDILGDASVFGFDLPGHAIGHTGLFWPESPDIKAPLIYGGDAQWLSAAILEDRPPKGPARLVYEDEAAMQISLDKLKFAVKMGCTLRLCHDHVDPSKTHIAPWS